MFNIELNITLQCNLSCPNCNRLCHVYKNRTEHMTSTQIKKFVDQARDVGGVNCVKVLGGEPLLNPEFVEIYNILTDACKEGVIKHIKIESNKTLPVPPVTQYPFVSWKGRVQKKKKHQPILWSPKDLGYDNGPQPNCPQIKKCGISLDKYGYLPCSLAIMISRLFGSTELYRHEFPKEIWGLDRLCNNCIFSMPDIWKEKYSGITIMHHTKEDVAPTKSYEDAINKFSNEEFYKNHKEF